MPKAFLPEEPPKPVLGGLEPGGLLPKGDGAPDAKPCAGWLAAALPNKPPVLAGKFGLVWLFPAAAPHARDGWDGAAFSAVGCCTAAARAPNVILPVGALVVAGAPKPYDVFGG